MATVTELPLREALQTDEPRRNDLIISNSVLTSCIAIDENGHFVDGRTDILSNLAVEQERLSKCQDPSH